MGIYFEGNYILIVYDGFPGQKAGILPDSRVLEVNGR
jgi:hypothetical protein